MGPKNACMWEGVVNPQGVEIFLSLKCHKNWYRFRQYRLIVFIQLFIC